MGNALKLTHPTILLSQAGAQQEDIDQASAQVRAAQGSLQVIQDGIDDMVLRAPFYARWRNCGNSENWEVMRSKKIQRFIFEVS